MAQNHIQPGETMPYTNSTGSDIASGSPVLVGARLGVALGDIADGASGQLAMCEVWEIAKEAALVVAQGAALYWDDVNGVLTTTATDNTLAGYAFAAAVGADATVLLKLNG